MNRDLYLVKRAEEPIDLNLVCLEGVLVAPPMHIGGSEWSARIHTDGENIRIRAGEEIAPYRVGDRLWLTGKVTDVMLTHVVIEEIRRIAEDPSDPLPSGA